MYSRCPCVTWMPRITNQNAPAASAENERCTEPGGAAADNDDVKRLIHIPPELNLLCSDSSARFALASGGLELGS